MEKYQNIHEDIESVTNKEVVRQNKLSMVAVGMLVAAIICSVAGFSLENPNSSISTFLFTAAIFLLFGGIIKFMMGRNCYFFRPTGSKVREITLYFDTKESHALQSCMENKQFEEIKRLKRQVNSGVKVDAMIAGDNKFAAVQISEYVPYTYEAISPVICYYGDEAKCFATYLTSTH